ncbi:protein PAXX isoform X4 [Oenanthe melanoleuca]|uniref:protein PAXX isoform X4 n=1 Tax=Oenanthe melanoleuca TaxID=2939378 RepID=UPI0024C1354E|nr:protein PAXX isoform X4 [Oenanthe melanoleuca]XP_056361415.1 protein PAXX isoform X4 [Oenanthe melanoleuca]
MAEPTGPFYLLRAGTGQFLCYWGSDGTVYVTDAMEVWAGEFGGCPALAGRCPPEEHGAMLRAGLGRGAAALSLGRGSATLQLPEEPRCPALALTQLPAAEACSQLQALVFGMAGCIESLERRLEGWHVPKVGRDLHHTSAGRRDPAWTQRTQCSGDVSIFLQP